MSKELEYVIAALTEKALRGGLTPTEEAILNQSFENTALQAMLKLAVTALEKISKFSTYYCPDCSSYTCDCYDMIAAKTLAKIKEANPS